MKIKVVSWNVNGIRAVYLKNFSNSIQQLNPDILAIQEVKCNDEKIIFEIFNELGYVFEVRTAQKKGYSGVLTAYKQILSSNLNFEDISQISNKVSLESYFYSEGRCLLLKLGKFYLLNIYVPSGSSSEERQQIKFRLMDNLLKWVDDLPGQIKENLIICGDINICHQELDIHHPKQANRLRLSGFLPEERSWFSNFLGLQFHDVFRAFNPESKEYTWWSYRAGARGKNLGWRLDYFLAGSHVFRHISGIKHHTEILGSDHCPVELEMEV